jgi:PAS domain-containing protein
MTDYKEFKDKQLKLLSGITPSFDLFYLKSGQTIKYSVIPIDANSTLFMYNDISDELKVERLNNILMTSLRDMIDIFPNVAIVFGQNARVKLCNKFSYDFFDIKEDSLIDNLEFKSLIDKATKFSPKDKSNIIEAIAKTLEIAQHQELQVIKNSVKVSIKPLKDFGLLFTIHKLEG